MNNDLSAKLNDLKWCKLVDVSSAKELKELVSEIQRQSSIPFELEEYVQEALEIEKKEITHIALRTEHFYHPNCYDYKFRLLAFFYFKKLRIANGNVRNISAYVCNLDYPTCSEYGSVAVENNDGEYYYVG